MAPTHGAIATRVPGRSDTRNWHPPTLLQRVRWSSRIRCSLRPGTFLANVTIPVPPRGPRLPRCGSRGRAEGVFAAQIDLGRPQLCLHSRHSRCLSHIRSDTLRAEQHVSKIEDYELVVLESGVAGN